MTLIVGRIVDGRPCFVGDTQLSFIYAGSRPFIDGCLKILIIRETLAVAFSGEKIHFDTVLPDIYNCETAEDIARLAVATQKNGGDYELMIADAVCDRIKVVKKGELVESAAGFVGCPHGFSLYQHYFHKYQDLVSEDYEVEKAQLKILKIPEPAGSGNNFMKMYGALKQVIQCREVPSVGGIIVPLGVHHGIFRYMGYIDLVSRVINPDEISSTPKAIEFGTAAEGGYAVEFWDDAESGGLGREVGFYFLQGGFGICFPADENFVKNSMLVKAENPAYWTIETRRISGNAIYSAYLNENHCLEAGYNFLTQRRYNEALFCFVLRCNSPLISSNPIFQDLYMAGYARALYECGRQKEALGVLESIFRTNRNAENCSLLMNEIL